MMEIECSGGVYLRKRIQKGAHLDVWCVHGYGESGFSFKEAFRLLNSRVNVYAPDARGFGASANTDTPSTVESITKDFLKLIRGYSGKRPIVLLAHSLGGIIATDLAKALGTQVKLFLNVEGSLTSDDCLFLGQVEKFADADSFTTSLYSELLSRLETDSSPEKAGFSRYYANIRFADPEALFSLGSSGVARTGEVDSGEAYARLPQEKIYLCGEMSVKRKTLDFLNDRGLTFCSFSDCGHWPMIDSETDFYQVVNRVLGDLFEPSPSEAGSFH